MRAFLRSGVGGRQKAWETTIERVLLKVGVEVTVRVAGLCGFRGVSPSAPLVHPRQG